MVRKNIFKKPICLLAFCLTLLMLMGCQSGLKLVKKPLMNSEKPLPRLSFFLHLKDPEGPGIRWQIKSIEILSDGQWLPVTDREIDLDSLDIEGRQLFLGSRDYTTGYYEKLRISISQVSYRLANGTYKDISDFPKELELSMPSVLLLNKEESKSLFLTWDVQNSIKEDGQIRPDLTVGFSVRQLPHDLVYVTCPEIDTVYIIRCDKNWVADSFGLNGHPSYLYANKDTSNQNLTFLTYADSAIKIVDLSTQRLIDSFHIPLTNTPEFMVLSADGLYAYVIDERNSYLSRLDLLNGSLTAHVHLGYQPQYARYLTERNVLAVSSVVNQTVSFHDPVTLNPVGSVRPGSTPDGLLDAGGSLYIAESRVNLVSIYDFPVNRIQTKIPVGFTPRRLLDTGRGIYVSNYDGGSISVILRGQLGVAREILGLGRPLEMVFDQTYNKLYVSDEQKNGVAVIDTTIDKQTGFIDLGARPLGLAVVE